MTELLDGFWFLEHCRELRRNAPPRAFQALFPLLDKALPSLPRDWTWASLSEICERVSVGHVGPTSEYFTNPDNGVPFIRSQDVRPGRLMLENAAYVTKEFHQRLKKSQLKPGDLLVVRVGANRGDSCVVPGGNTTLNCANIVFARPIVRNGYLGYYLRSNLGCQKLLSLTTGSAQGVLNTQSIAAMPVPVPPLGIQAKIAAILSAYDDLIEKNLRRIKILEEMAQSLYREWFVKFRYPGHEKVRMVDSPLSKIPSGWEIMPLAGVCNLVMGQSPKSEFYNEQGDGLPFHQGVTHFGERFPNNRIYCTEMNRIAEAGDILFSVRAPVGRINIAHTRLIIGRGLAAIRSKSGNQWFTFRQLKEQFKNEDTMGGGTIFKAVTKQDMEGIQFVRPAAETINDFESRFDPVEREIGNLIQRNRVLRSTRDLLLPKLILGELDVSELDIRIPEEAA